MTDSPPFSWAPLMAAVLACSYSKSRRKNGANLRARHGNKMGGWTLFLLSFSLTPLWNRTHLYRLVPRILYLFLTGFWGGCTPMFCPFFCWILMTCHSLRLCDVRLRNVVTMLYILPFWIHRFECEVFNEQCQLVTVPVVYLPTQI